MQSGVSKLNKNSGLMIRTVCTYDDSCCMYMIQIILVRIDCWLRQVQPVVGVSNHPTCTPNKTHDGAQNATRIKTLPSGPLYMATQFWQRTDYCNHLIHSVSMYFRNGVIEYRWHVSVGRRTTKVHRNIDIDPIFGGLTLYALHSWIVYLPLPDNADKLSC